LLRRSEPFDGRGLRAMQDKGDTMELRSVRRWSLTALVIAAVVLDIAIVVWPNWAETLFGIDTDAGSGSFETAVAVALTLVTVVAAFASGWEWRASARREHTVRASDSVM
jgi:hypothetical protein